MNLKRRETKNNKSRKFANDGCIFLKREPSLCNIAQHLSLTLISEKICIPTCWAYFLYIYFDVVFRTLTAAATLTLK